MSTESSSQIKLPLTGLTGFLTLAPITSASYPTRRSSSNASAQATNASVTKESSLATASTAATDVVSSTTTSVISAEVDLLKQHHRRTSSLSSEGSNGSARRLRFLRLGPVHHGEQLAGEGDWSEEVAVAE